jgi:23S rRNA (uracil1939-C5)-methyltransferase
MERVNGVEGPARIVAIESLDQEGRGVGRWQGKAIFVDGALPGETVEFSPYRRKPTYEFAQASKILRASSQRTQPPCPHFGTCGGCSLQHQDPRAQVAAKQRILEDALWHIGRVRPDHMLPPIYGPTWEYRHRARLTVRNVPKKGGILVGFHERRRSYVADMTSCAVLPRRISMLLPQLRVLVAQLSVHDRLPQIELACADNFDAFVLRILRPLNAADETVIRRFADEHGVAIYLQPSGPDSAHLFHPRSAGELSYRIPAFGVVLNFSPTEFTQINAAMNRVLVPRAVRLLAPLPGERVADLFCGLGNFSLAIASLGVDVIGVEGLEGLVRRAKDNAERNGLANNCKFVSADLSKITTADLIGFGRIDRMLIDPPRDGAMRVIMALDGPTPERIVYVSCNPATLARDAGALTQLKGYTLAAAGVVNMFPHTAHVESIAVFDRGH